jgi:hypothetical protein
MHYHKTILVVGALLGTMVAAHPTATQTSASPVTKREAAADPMSTAAKQKAGYVLSSMANGAGMVAKVADRIAETKPSTPKPAAHQPGESWLDLTKREAEAMPEPMLTSGEIHGAERGAAALARSGTVKTIEEGGVKGFRKVAGVVGKVASVTQSGLDTAAQAMQASGHPSHKKRSLHLPHLTPNTKKNIEKGVKIAGEVAMTAAPLFLKD